MMGKPSGDTQELTAGCLKALRRTRGLVFLGAKAEKLSPKNVIFQGLGTVATLLNLPL